MHTNPRPHLPSIFAAGLGLAIAPACSLDVSDAGEFGSLTGLGEETSGATATGDEFGTTDGSDTDTEPDPGSPCSLPCEGGECVMDNGDAFCDCPEGTAWTGISCDACPIVEDVPTYVLELEVVEFAGRFTVGRALPPTHEYDDGNVYLENRHTGDRVLLGNTHDWDFHVRVTPGLYDVWYEVETPGPILPHNRRAHLGKRALFGSGQADVLLDIPVVRVSGELLIDGDTPPDIEYDDANILLREVGAKPEHEILAGNTHDGSYSANVIPGLYEVVYRNETPGPIAPRNVGAVLELVDAREDIVDHTLDILTVTINGEYMLDGAPAPDNEYNDANIELRSVDLVRELGVVPIGNTHDVSYALPVLAGSYDIMYRHETGLNVPQNQYGRVATIDASAGGTFDVEIEMLTLSGMLTINDAMAPNDEFDDGVLFLRGVDTDDTVLLGNTHDLGYQVNLLAGTYDVMYAQETAGGTVPENTNARVMSSEGIDADGVLDIDIGAVLVTGSFSFAGAAPPDSVYEAGRVYLRSTDGQDTVLLGSTHDGSYTALVVPGTYDAYYVQEVGGLVPGNQNALLESVSIDGPMQKDFNISRVGFAGSLTVNGGAPPATASDGGQLYLRRVGGDSVLLGDSFVPGFAANLVAGVYGVYYRAEGSITMPQNENGRFACVEIK